MSAVLAEKAVEVFARLSDEKLKTVRLFRRNACMKHGLPYEEDANGTIPLPSRPQEEKQSIDINKVVEQVVSKIPAGKDGRDAPPIDTDALVNQIAARIPAAGKGLTLKDWLKIGTLATLGAGGVGGGVAYILKDDPQTVQPPPSSVLQYLEDEGYSVHENGVAHDK